jgi:hypothetical protein
VVYGTYCVVADDIWGSVVRSMVDKLTETCCAEERIIKELEVSFFMC